MSAIFSHVPKVASVWQPPRAKTSSLEALCRSHGEYVEIEAGPIGLVIYGASRRAVDRASQLLLGSIKEKDGRAELEAIDTDPTESAETRWHAVLTFDWARL